MSGANRKKVGSFVGTGSDINIRTVGFRPKSVHILNLDGLCQAWWNEEMADASAIKQVTAGTISAITSKGITPLSNGFTLGDDTDLNVDGEKFYWECFD